MMHEGAARRAADNCRDVACPCGATGSGGTLQSPLARCRRTGQEPCRVLRVDLTVSMGTAKMMSDHVDDGCDEVEFTQESAEDEVVNYLEEGVREMTREEADRGASPTARSVDSRSTRTS